MRSALTLIATTALLLSSVSSVLAADISFVAIPERDNKAELKDYLSAYSTAAKVSGVTVYTFDGSWEAMQGPNEPMTQLLIGVSDASKKTSTPASLTLGLIDATGRTIPKDLKRERWGSPQMLIQIDLWLRNISRVTGDNVKWISFGNDTDLYFADNKAELEAFLAFYKKISVSAKRVFPNAKLGLTITHEGLTGERKAIAEQILAASDAAFISYYPATSDFTLKDEEAIKTDITSLSTNTLAKPVVLKEFGFPSSAKNKNNPEAQVKFYETYLPELKNSATVDLVTISDLHDRTAASCKQQQNAREIKERDYASFCGSLGLRESNGKKKPAWKTVETLLQAAPAAPVAQ